MSELYFLYRSGNIWKEKQKRYHQFGMIRTHVIERDEEFEFRLRKSECFFLLAMVMIETTDRDGQGRLCAISAAEAVEHRGE